MIGRMAFGPVTNQYSIAEAWSGESVFTSWPGMEERGRKEKGPTVPF